MKANSQSTHSKQKFPVVESDGTFRMQWLVSFFDMPMVEAKEKLDKLVKIHQKENKLMISQKRTGQGVKPFHVYWQDYFLSTKVTYFDEKNQAQIEFQAKNPKGFWKDLMAMFFSELKYQLPYVQIRSLQHLRAVHEKRSKDTLS